MRAACHPTHIHKRIQKDTRVKTHMNQFFGGSTLENVREFCNSIGLESQHYETYKTLTNRIVEFSDIV